MSKKNKIYWFEGVTEKGVKSLLTDENSKYRWLRSQRNRRMLVVVMSLGFVLLAMGSYWPTLKTGSLILNSGAEIAIYSVTAIFVIFAVIGGYLLLRISVRGIADAPNELLDERQIKIRDTSFRYAYYTLGYLIMALLILMLYAPGLKLKLFEPEGNDGIFLITSILITCASLPSMVLAWREKDI